jgi:hypothetical protein
MECPLDFRCLEYQIDRPQSMMIRAVVVFYVAIVLVARRVNHRLDPDSCKCRDNVTYERLHR